MGLRSEERRELFDEAAGIVKFKKRKVAAQKKLEDEKQNLVRVNDILSELEKQVGPLEKQSEKAKIYLKKKEELKTLDVNLFLLENLHLQEQLSSATEKYQIASDDLAETSKRYEQIKEEYEKVQAEIEQLDAAIEQERNTITDTSVMRGKLEGEINVLKEQIKSAQSNEEHFLSRQQAIQKEIDDRSLDKEGILKDKSVIDEQVAEIEKTRNEAKEKLLAVQKAIEELNNEIESGKNTIIDALNARATIKSKLGRYDSMTEQINIRKSELTSRILRVKSDEAQQEAVIKSLEEEFEKINEQIRTLNDSQQSKEEKIFKLLRLRNTR